MRYSTEKGSRESIPGHTIKQSLGIKTHGSEDSNAYQSVS